MLALNTEPPAQLCNCASGAAADAASVWDLGLEAAVGEVAVRPMHIQERKLAGGGGDL